MWSEVKIAVEIMENGGVILYPTDTIWGIGCDALNEIAIDKIFKLKNRADSKSLIILLAEAKDIFKYVANPHPDIVSIVQSFEEPTTVIYNQAIGLPSSLISEDGSIAIRVTKDPFCKSLIKRMKKPLVSTSANISGNPAPKGFSSIESEIKNGVDYIVTHRQNEPYKALKPSTIIRIHADGSKDVIRA